MTRIYFKIIIAPKLNTKLNNLNTTRTNFEFDMSNFLEKISI